MKKYESPHIRVLRMNVISLVCGTIMNAGLSDTGQDNDQALTKEYQFLNHHGLNNNWECDEEE